MYPETCQPATLLSVVSTCEVQCEGEGMGDGISVCAGVKYRGTPLTSAVPSVVYITVHNTVCRTVHNTVYNTVYSTVYSIVHCTPIHQS